MSKSNSLDPEADRDELLRKIVSHLSEITETIVLRKNVRIGSLNCFWGLIVLGLGIAWTKHVAPVMPDTLGGLLFIILGTGLLLWGLSNVVDRSPQLSLRPDGIIDHRTTPTALFVPWTSITGASFRRETSNYHDVNATIELSLAMPSGDRNSIVMNVVDLGMPSAEIFKIVRRRAKLG